MRRLILAALLGAGLLITAPATMAAPSKATGTVQINQTDVRYGDSITFTVTTNAYSSDVYIVCSQDGTIVAQGNTVNHDAGTYVTDTTGMYSPAWPSGAADCTATLRDILSNKHGFWKAVPITTIAFEVGA